MRIPLSWLKEYIDLPFKVSEIAHKLTMAGLEVDGYESIGEAVQEVVVGRVLEASKHPNADKLSVAKVTDGKETYQVVCGAPNCRAGIKVAFARIGTTIKDFKIKAAKLRGVESFGMLCSGHELGLSDEQDGILELPEHWPEGTSLAEFYADTIFEISLTPNLNHCASVMGVARELAAITGQSLRLPQIEVQESGEGVEDSLRVEIIDREACPRYACRVIKNVKVGPSPDWLRKRVEECGLRSINNIVDVTNYVLLELGQPLHAFDYDRLEGHEIVVRKAKEGEVLQTLDGKERVLKENMLAICDQHRPVAIAGVMGGLNSEVTDQTQHVVIESAYFEPRGIRRTSKQLGLQTDASKRFERGADPNQVLFALNRAAMLMQKVAGGKIQAGLIDVKEQEFSEIFVPCRLNRINQVLGMVFSRGEVENIFKNLGFAYQWDGQDKFTVKIPTYRVDIKGEIDLVEEVARLYGYDNLSRQGGRYQTSTLPSTPIYVFEEKVRSQLVAEGLQEFLTCDLIGPSLLQIVQDHSVPPESIVKVMNPTSVEQSILRTSLLPGLLQVVKYNVDHQNHDVSGFEIGRIHFRDGEQYKEQSVAGIILTGKSEPHDWKQKSQNYDFFDLKGIVENFLGELGITQLTFKNLTLPTFHSGRQASIFVDSLEIGSIGEIHPAIQRRLDIPQRILFGEFDLQGLIQVAKPLEKIKPLAMYPGSERDWTFTVKETVPFAKVVSLIQAQRSPLLEEVSLKDIYRSDKLSSGYQNLTLHFIYRDLAKTVGQEEVETEHQRLTTSVLQQLGDAVKL